MVRLKLFKICMMLCGMMSFLSTWGVLHVQPCFWFLFIPFPLHLSLCMHVVCAERTMRHGICCRKQGLKVVYFQSWSGQGMLSWYVHFYVPSSCFIIWRFYTEVFLFHKWSKAEIDINIKCRGHKSKDYIHYWLSKTLLQIFLEI